MEKIVLDISMKKQENEDFSPLVIVNEKRIVTSEKTVFAWEGFIFPFEKLVSFFSSWFHAFKKEEKIFTTEYIEILAIKEGGVIEKLDKLPECIVTRLTTYSEDRK